VWSVSVVLISHNRPYVFEVADRIHIQRRGPVRRDTPEVGGAETPPTPVNRL
jgi:ABC-type sugar transport system ATPase subunit